MKVDVANMEDKLPVLFLLALAWGIVSQFLLSLEFEKALFISSEIVAIFSAYYFGREFSELLAEQKPDISGTDKLKYQIFAVLVLGVLQTLFLIGALRIAQLIANSLF